MLRCFLLLSACCRVEQWLFHFHFPTIVVYYLHRSPPGCQRPDFIEADFAPRRRRVRRKICRYQLRVAYTAEMITILTAALMRAAQHARYNAAPEARRP